MVKIKLHQFEKLFHTLTKQLYHASQNLAQLQVEMAMAYDTIVDLKDEATASMFFDELAE